MYIELQPRLVYRCAHCPYRVTLRERYAPGSLSHEGCPNGDEFGAGPLEQVGH